MDLSTARVLVAGATGVLGGALTLDGLRNGRRELRYDLQKGELAVR